MKTPVNKWHEKRQSIRIPNDMLPATLKTLWVDFGNENKKHFVQTIDASFSGISFKVDKPANSFHDYMLTISASDTSFILKEEIVYIKPLDANTSRVSVHFSQQPGLNKYINQLKEAILRND